MKINQPTMQHSTLLCLLLTVGFLTHGMQALAADQSNKVTPVGAGAPKPLATTAAVKVPSKIGDTIVNSAGIKLTYIPAGEFVMGSPTTEERRVFSDEKQHKVTLTRAFMMGVTEVTQAQWKARAIASKRAAGL